MSEVVMQKMGFATVMVKTQVSISLKKSRRELKNCIAPPATHYYQKAAIRSMTYTVNDAIKEIKRHFFWIRKHYF